jgi:hypothetical protein
MNRLDSLSQKTKFPIALLATVQNMLILYLSQSTQLQTSTVHITVLFGGVESVSGKTQWGGFNSEPDF